MAVSPTTLDTANKAAALTLSNGNLTATNSGTPFGSVLSVFRANTATKYYFEVTTGANCGSASFGITDHVFSLAADLANTSNNAAVLASSGAVRVNGATQATLAGVSFASGNTFCVAVDAGAALVWFRAGAAGQWNGSGTANPATGVGGVNVNAIVAVPTFPAIAALCLGGIANAALTANFGATAFVGTAPSGYQPGWGAALGPTTLSTIDQTGLTLSNGNLTASITGTAVTGAARSIYAAATGKFYWEATITALQSAQYTSVGVANFSAALLNTPLNKVNVANVAATGVITINGTATGTTIAAIAVGRTYGIALDVDAGRIWFRDSVNGASVWNASGANNPATGVGGLDVSAMISTAKQAFAWVQANVPGTGTSTVTANFGATAFTIGTAPTGFSPVFGVAVDPSAQLTQIGLEQWVNANADAQLTQIVLEHWGPAGTTTPLAVVTQVALEQWSSVGDIVVPPVIGVQRRAWIMA